MEDNLNYTNSLTQENQNNSLQTIEITPTLRQDFTSTLKWGKFFAIMIFISVGILVLIGILMLTYKSFLDEMDIESFSANISMTTSAVIYFVMAIINLVLGCLLWKSVKKLSIGLNENIQQQINEGIHSLKLFMQITGVLTIISLAVILLVILGVVVLALAVAL